MPRSPKNKNIYEALSSKQAPVHSTPTRPPASRPPSKTTRTPTKISRSENSALAANTTTSSTTSTTRPGIVNDAINAIFQGGNSKLSRDEAITLPITISHGVKVPTIAFRTNTHRGNSFTVMEGKPARVGDFLWLQAEIPRTGSTPGDNTISPGFTAGILQYMTQCMRSRLEKLSARQVNAKIFMRKPTNTHCIIVCVVGFKTEKPSTDTLSS